MAFVAEALPGMPTRNLHKLENSALIDMLAEYTLKFTHLFCISTGIRPSREYQNCKKKLEKIIEELVARGLVPPSAHSKEEELSLFPTDNI
jgi:hypothetical protein